MGLLHNDSADLVLFPNARRASELFARPHLDRIVLRAGRLQSSSLPDFRDLDDLVASKTPRTDADPSAITRGGNTGNVKPAA
mmetsp:Transcript_11525/g.46649  ORF Transcript_11525/g.46649 Transcript_11525/m.46649 type:complete len:82 (+) Transcript_11525:162-407(+)